MKLKVSTLKPEKYVCIQASCLKSGLCCTCLYIDYLFWKQLPLNIFLFLLLIFLKTVGLFDRIVYHFSPKAYCIVLGLLSLKTCFAVFSCPYRQMSLDALAGTSVHVKQKWGTRRRTGLNSTIWWQYCHCDGTILTFCLYSCFWMT